MLRKSMFTIYFSADETILPFSSPFKTLLGNSQKCIFPGYFFFSPLDSSFDHSQMLLYFIRKFTPCTAGLLKTQPKLCEMFLQLLSISKSLFHGHLTPQEAIINQVKTTRII